MGNHIKAHGPTMTEIGMTPIHINMAMNILIHILSDGKERNIDGEGIP